MTKKELKKFLEMVGALLVNNVPQNERRLYWHWKRAMNKVHGKKK